MNAVSDERARTEPPLQDIGELPISRFGQPRRVFISLLASSCLGAFPHALATPGTIERAQAGMASPARDETMHVRNDRAGTSVCKYQRTQPCYGEAGVRLSAFTCCFTSREV